MQIVNGHVCFNCTEVERAKKGLDPAAAPIGPDPEQPAGRQGLRSDQRVAEIAKADGPLGDHNKPLTFGDRGRQVNLLA